jgi:ribosomal protein S18 acetylase RimI-like enzyme
MLEILEVKNKADLKKFIYLPEKIHKNHKNWLHPLYSDEWILFDPKKNKAFNYCDTLLVIAKKDGKVVGRIMGIINHRYNEINNDNSGRFCFMESWEDQEVFHELVSFVEDWARNKGMKKLIGPFGFSDEDPQGFLVDGFDQPTVMITNCSLPHMANMIEDEGFSKKMDFVQYNIKTPEKVPAIYERIAQRPEKNGYKLVEFTKRKQLKPFIRPVLGLTNDTYTEIFGYVPFSDEEMDDFAKRYLPILDPRFIKVIIDTNSKVVAYVIGMPNISDGIRKAKGRLFPFGFIKILRSMKKSNQLDLLLGAVKDDLRNIGLDTMMAKAMLKSTNERGLESIDSHVVMETNTKMRAEVEKLGGKVYKRYRIFQKDL